MRDAFMLHLMHTCMHATVLLCSPPHIIARAMSRGKGVIEILLAGRQRLSMQRDRRCDARCLRCGATDACSAARCAAFSVLLRCFAFAALRCRFTTSPAPSRFSPYIRKARRSLLASY